MTRISRSRRRLPVIAVAGVFIVFLLGALYIGRGVVGGLLLRTAALLTSSRAAVHEGGSGFFAQFASKADLAAENTRLREALATSSALLAERATLLEENAALKARLGRAAPAPGLLATVILKPPLTPYDTLGIDVGLAEGIRVGDLVSSDGVAVIGTVVAVYEHSARAELFSSPQSSVSASLRTAASSSNIMPITVAGEGGGALSAQVPAGTPVSVGDRVTFPGLEAAFIGAVSAVRRSEGESFDTVYLHLPVNLFALRFVEVFHAHEVPPPPEEHDDPQEEQ